MPVHISSTIHREIEGGFASVILGFIHYLKQQGLSLPQVNALLFIYHTDRCQVSDISIFTDSSTAAASQLVERLVQKGLVDRQEDPADRRNKRVTLSDKGKGLIHASVMENQFLMEIVAKLTPNRARSSTTHSCCLPKRVDKSRTEPKKTTRAHHDK